MKNRIISGLLTAVFVLSTGTAVRTDAAAPRSNALLYALGIIDTDISAEAAAGAPLSRADAAYYTLKVAGYEIPEFSGSIYSDVTAETKNAAAVNYCANLQICAPGDAYRPTDGVKLAELFKMIETALGYGEVADMLGGWSTGYMQLARNLVLDDGLRSKSADSVVTYGELEAILTNTLMSPRLEIQKFSGESEYTLNNNENVLYQLFDVYKVTGTVTANAATTLTAPVGVGSSCVRIGSERYRVDAPAYPALSAKLGYEVNVWVRDTDGDALIISFEERTTNTEIIDAEDFEQLTDGVLTYKSGSRRKNLTIPASCGIIYNGRATERELDPDVFAGRWGSVTLIRDGSRITGVIINAYDNYYVGNIDAEKFACYDNTVSNRKISFADGDDLSELATFRDNAGNALGFGDISVGSVLSVAQNGTVYDCIIVKESISGLLESVSTDDGTYMAFVDNNTYELSPEMQSSRTMSLKTGSTYRFFLDAGGRIAAAKLEMSAGRAMDWVYLLDVIDEQELSAAAVRVLTAANERELVPVADRVKIDGTVYKDADAGELKTLFKKANSPSGELCQPMKIAVNADGRITDIDTIYYNAAGENVSDSANRFYNNDSDTLYFKSNINAFGMKVGYNAQTVVFCTPPGSDNRDFIALGVDSFVVDTKYNVYGYNSDKNSRTAEVIVCTDAMAAARQMWMQDYLTVVTDASTRVDEVGDVVTVLKGYQGGALKEWTLEDESVLATGTGTVAKGDSIRFSTGKEGTINQIQLVYDCSARKYYQPTPIAGDTSDGIARLGSAYQRMQIGIVQPFRIADGSMVTAVNMAVKPDDEGQEYIVNKLTTFKIYVVDAGGAVSVRTGTQDDIHDWYNYGTDEDTDVLMRCRYDEGRDLVIYNY